MILLSFALGHFAECASYQRKGSTLHRGRPGAVCKYCAWYGSSRCERPSVDLQHLERDTCVAVSYAVHAAMDSFYERHMLTE